MRLSTITLLAAVAILLSCNSDDTSKTYSALEGVWVGTSIKYSNPIIIKNTSITINLSGEVYETSSKKLAGNIKLFDTDSLSGTFTVQNENENGEMIVKGKLISDTIIFLQGKYSYTGTSGAEVIQVEINLVKNGIIDGQWLLQNSPLTDPSYLINNISVANQNTVWASVLSIKDNMIYPCLDFIMTKNGGINWVKNTITGLDPQSTFSNIFAIDENNAWAAINNTGRGGIVGKTSNGGASWNFSDSSMFSIPDGFLNFVHFFNSQQGVSMGDPNNGYFEIYTTNNADSWARIANPDIPTPLANEYGIAGLYTTYGDTIWFCTSKGRVFRSTDKGQHWTVTEAFNDGTTILGIAFKDGLNGLIFGSGSGNIKKTTDGGTSWNTLEFIGNFWFSNAQDIKYVKSDGNTPGFYITGSYNSLHPMASISIDDGSSWVQVDNLYHTCFGFYNSGLGWTGTHSKENSNATIYRTTNLIINQ
jgi:photosystem II stability/assembly factor-like uncharacterized protein